MTGGMPRIDQLPPELAGRARDFWNEKHEQDIARREQDTPAPDPIDYTQHWFLYNFSVSRPLAGDTAKYWLDEIGRLYLTPPPERMLSLGCGPAFIEEQVVERNLARHIVAYEISASAVELARRRLDATPWGARIELRCADVLRADLPDHSFDAVFVEAALHHFVEIEEVFRLMHRVLVPGGLLLYEEYVGPDHHQYPPELVDLINRINACLTPELRRDYETGAVRERVEACPLELALERDPTEGIHASQILPLTYRWFEVIDRRDYGGAVMRPLFSRILRNWDFETNPKDQTIAQLIVLIEQELMRCAAIPTHNTLVIARPRPNPLPPLRAEEVERIGYGDWKAPHRC